VRSDLPGFFFIVLVVGAIADSTLGKTIVAVEYPGK
jgi:hypothetical protein